MNIWQAKPEELIANAQLAVGMVVLVGLSVFLHVSGRMRRAFDWPAAPANSLTGAHLLSALIVFLLSIQLLNSSLTLLGYASPASLPAASAPSTASATRPEATQPDRTAPSPATATAKSDQDSLDQADDAPVTAQPADAEADSPSTQSENSAESAGEEMHEQPIRFAFQGLAELVTVAVMLYMARLSFAGGLRGMGLRADRLRWDFSWAIIGYLAFWPACSVLAESSTWLYQHLVARPQEHQVLMLLENPDLSLGWQVVAWLLAGLVAPLFEELLFRGLLLTWLRKVTRSTELAIVISGLAFGVIHMPQWHLVPALSLLGIVLGYLYARTGSLTLVILFHAIFNLRTLVMMEVARLCAT